MAADERHVLLVVLIIVALEQLDADQPLAAVRQRDENAERLHARDLGVEFLADKLLHIGGDEQLVNVALAVVRRLFAGGGLRGGILAQVLVCRGKFLAGQRFLQHTVRDQIGIAADGRGEMQVIPGLEAVVPDALVRIACAGQAAQQQHGQDALARVVFRAAQHGLELRGVPGLGRVDAVAERPRELREHAQFFRVRVFVHAVYGRVAALAHELRDRLVGLQHKFLDQLFALAALAVHDLYRLALLIHTDFGLRNVELERAALDAALVERVGQLVHLFRRRHEKGVFRAQRRIARQDLVDLAVGHARGRADDRLGEHGAVAPPVPVELHQGGKREPLHLGVQRADAVRQRKRQHRHHMAGIVDRRAAAVGLLVERAAGRDIVGHVRNVHAEQIMAVVQPLKRNRVVKVFGVVAVDRKDQLVPQVEPVAGRGQVHLLRDGVRLAQHFVREGVEHGVFVQNGRDRGLHRAVLAKVGLDDALWGDFVVPIIRNRHRHAVADLGLA